MSEIVDRIKKEIKAAKNGDKKARKNIVIAVAACLIIIAILKG